MCVIVRSGRGGLFISSSVLLNKALGYSVFLQFVPEHLLCLSPRVFLKTKKKKGDSRGSRHLWNEAVILLSHLPVSPAQTNKAVHKLYPSYPVTLLRILSFFVGQWAFVEEKIIVWASVAAVWLLWCDIQRLWNCQMNSFADQHWPMLLQLLLVHVFLVRQLCMERAAPLQSLGPPVEGSQPVGTFLILFIPHLHWLSDLKKKKRNNSWYAPCWMTGEITIYVINN